MLKTFTIVPSDLRCIVICKSRIEQRKFTYSNGSSTSTTYSYGSWTESTYNYQYTPLTFGYSHTETSWVQKTMYGNPPTSGYVIEQRTRYEYYYRIVATCDFSSYSRYTLSSMKITLTPSASVSSQEFYVSLKNNATATSSTYGTGVSKTISGVSAQIFDVTSLGVPSYGLVVHSEPLATSIVKISSVVIKITVDVTGVGHVNVNGAWKEATIYMNVGGTWKETVPYVNVGGTWKEGI